MRKRIDISTRVFFVLIFILVFAVEARIAPLLAQGGGSQSQSTRDLREAVKNAEGKTKEAQQASNTAAALEGEAQKAEAEVEKKLENRKETIDKELEAAKKDAQEKRKKADETGKAGDKKAADDADKAVDDKLRKLGKAQDDILDATNKAKGKRKKADDAKKAADSKKDDARAAIGEAEGLLPPGAEDSEVSPIRKAAEKLEELGDTLDGLPLLPPPLPEPVVIHDEAGKGSQQKFQDIKRERPKPIKTPAAGSCH